MKVPDRNEIVCTCMDVTIKDLEDAIRNGADTEERVMKITGAGSGCGVCDSGCRKLIEMMLAQEWNT